MWPDPPVDPGCGNWMPWRGAPVTSWIPEASDSQEPPLHGSCIWSIHRRTSTLSTASLSRIRQNPMNHGFPRNDARWFNWGEIVRVIDDTKADIERLIAADFGNSASGDYQSDFVSWLHYRARRMPRLHRKVFLSQEIKLHLASYPAIGKIRSNLEQGGNLEPWLRIEKRKPDHRADMMFNDWMIQHFHLGEVYQSPSVIKRTGQLLFAHIRADEATLLDVQPHGSWSMIRLL